jgi:hypothetical protein
MKTTHLLILACGCAMLLAGCGKTSPESSSSTPTSSSPTSSENDYRSSSLAPSAYSLVSGGVSVYQIVTALTASETERYCASQLHDFFYQVSGASLPVVSESGLTYAADSRFITFGDTQLASQAAFTFDASALNGDGFYLKTIGESLFIGGPSGNSLLNGTFEILESTLGVRFLSGDDTYVPNNVSEVPLYQYDKAYAPLLRHRLYLNPYTYGSSTSKALYCAHLGYAGEYCDKPSYLGENIGWNRDIGAADHNALLYVKPSDYDENGDGLVDDAYCHMFAHYGGDDSTDSVWVNSSTGGVVAGHGENTEILDLCYTDGLTSDGKIAASANLTTAQAMVASLEALLSAAGGVTSNYYMMGMMDRAIGCPCDRCKAAAEKYGRSGLMVRFANAVAAEVQAWVDENYPGEQFNLVIFAYHYTLDAPVKDEADGSFTPYDPSVVPASNVFVRVANIDAHYLYPLNDPHQELEVKNPFTRWGALTKNMMTWSYSGDFNDTFWYYSTINTFKKTIQFLSAVGTQYAMIQSNYFEPVAFLPTLESYVASKLFWNPYQDTQAIIDDFLVHYVGKEAAPFVEEFIESMDERYQYLLATDKNFHPTSSEEDYKAATYWPVQFLDNAIATLASALDAAANDASLNGEEKSQVKERLEKIQLTPRYMEARNYGFYYPSSPVAQRAYVESWASDASRLGAKRVGENRAHTLSYFVSTYGG